MKEYVASIHKIKATKHQKSPLWKACTLQIYFIGYGRIDYFMIIDDKEKGGVSKQTNNSILLTQPKKELFKKLEKDYKDIKYDLEE